VMRLAILALCLCAVACSGDQPSIGTPEIGAPEPAGMRRLYPEGAMNMPTHTTG